MKSKKSFPPKKPKAVYSASHSNYPTAAKIHKFIIDSKISQIELSLEHINSLLDILIFDGKIERKIKVSDAEEYDLVEEDDEPEIVYKAVKNRQDGRGNAWTDSPCGNCPVW